MLALVGTVLSRSASGNVLLRDGDGVLGTHRLAEQGRSFTALQALEFAEFVHRTCVTVDRWWEEENLDLLLSPTLAQRTPPITEYLPPPVGTYVVSLDDPASIALAMLALFPLVCFTQLFNWTGQPAVSLPLGVDDDGLPVGVQLAARRLREDHLLDVAAELETARPWAGRARGHRTALDPPRRIGMGADVRP
jgi:Asp-tRNA(Asn)/Glu-tRNA(Gln) amidotransferase A subunit family amidase